MSRVSNTSTLGEVQAAEIGLIMAGSSTKDIRMGFLKQLWRERPVKVMGDMDWRRLGCQQRYQIWVGTRWRRYLV